MHDPLLAMCCRKLRNTKAVLVASRFYLATPVRTKLRDGVSIEWQPRLAASVARSQLALSHH